MLTAILVLAFAGEAAFDADLAKQLAGVKRVYVEKLTGGEVAAQIRDMIICSLQRSGKFVVTENPDRADVALRGSAEDMVFTDTFQSNDSLSARTSFGVSDGRSSTNRKGISTSAGVSENDSVRIQERKHEAVASVRLVNKDGDVLWSTTQESLGAKFRGSSADVAEKVAQRLIEDIEAVKKKLAGEGKK